MNNDLDLQGDLEDFKYNMQLISLINFDDRKVNGSQDSHFQCEGSLTSGIRVMDSYIKDARQIESLLSVPQL